MQKATETIFCTGLNSIQEMLKRLGSGPRPNVTHTLVRLILRNQPRPTPRVLNILSIADGQKIKIQRLQENVFRSSLALNRLDESEGSHQGLVAEIEGLGTRHIAELDYESVSAPFIVLDGITDPHNLGAIIRTAAFYGCAGILIPEDRSAKIGPTVFKVASGGCEYVPVYTVANLPKSVAKMQQFGYKIIGLSEHGSETIEKSPKVDWAKTILIVGSEDRGIRPAIKEICDNWVSIKGLNNISLNASVAFSIALTELKNLK